MQSSLHTALPARTWGTLRSPWRCRRWVIEDSVSLLAPLTAECTWDFLVVFCGQLKSETYWPRQVQRPQPPPCPSLKPTPFASLRQHLHLPQLLTATSWSEGLWMP